MEYILIVLVAVIVAIIYIGALHIILNLSESKNENKCIIPFKESFDLFDVPVVTFVSNNNKIRLLIDTGSSNSVLDTRYCKYVDILSKDSYSMQFQTGGGVLKSEGRIEVKLLYENTEYAEKFFVTDIKDQLNTAFSSFVDIHGVLGCSFFKKYGYDVNFEEFKIYANKTEKVISKKELLIAKIKILIKKIKKWFI